MHDQIFAAPIARLGDFCFDEQVVDVFPDMIQRSVPGYSNIISAIGMMAARYAQPQSRLYDLGCSLGAATQAMRRHVTQPGCQITAVDLSHPMIERARAHLSGFKSEVPVELVEADICDIPIENASVVVLNFTLQFVAPEKRAALIARIFDGLRPGGAGPDRQRRQGLPQPPHHPGGARRQRPACRAQGQGHGGQYGLDPHASSPGGQREGCCENNRPVANRGYL